jgi:hypothetical protein
MPKAKAAEAGGKGPDTCMLKMGKSNNVIQWREEMYNLATEEFGEVGKYFYTNVAYKYPLPHEREYNPFYVEPVLKVSTDEDEDDVYFDVEEDIGDTEDTAAEEAAEVTPAPNVPEAAKQKLINKLREGAFEARRK